MTPCPRPHDRRPFTRSHDPDTHRVGAPAARVREHSKLVGCVIKDERCNGLSPHIGAAAIEGRTAQTMFRTSDLCRQPKVYGLRGRPKLCACAAAFGEISGAPLDPRVSRWTRRIGARSSGNDLRATVMISTRTPEGRSDLREPPPHRWRRRRVQQAKARLFRSRRS